MSSQKVGHVTCVELVELKGNLMLNTDDAVIIVGKTKNALISLRQQTLPSEKKSSSSTKLPSTIFPPGYDDDTENLTVDVYSGAKLIDSVYFFYPEDKLTRKLFSLKYKVIIYIFIYLTIIYCKFNIYQTTVNNIFSLLGY